MTYYGHRLSGSGLAGKVQKPTASAASVPGECLWADYRSRPLARWPDYLAGGTLPCSG